MLAPSRRTLGILCIAGFSLAAAGWYQALKGNAASPPAAAGAAGSGKSRDSGRRGSALQDRSIMSDPRSIRLVELMEKLDEGARPGEPNPAFIKAAELTLNDSLFHRRQRDFRLLMEKMRPEDAPAIHKHFKDLEREGKYFGPEYAAFAMRWGAVDGEAATANWMERGPGQPFPDLVNMITGWATADAEKALEWVESNKDSLGDADAYSPLLVGWLATDPVAATAWLTNSDLGPGRYAQCVTAGVLDKIYSDGLDGASEWLSSLPDDTGDRAAALRAGWQIHVSHLSNLDPALAASAWSKVGSKSWMEPMDFQRFCNSVARGNGGNLEAFAEQLSKNWQDNEASAQFERWAGQDPETVGVLLAQFPPSDIRDAGLSGLLRALESSDPDAAARWREQLGK